jgi:hypothetical protein
MYGDTSVQAACGPYQTKSISTRPYTDDESINLSLQAFGFA